jgi:hypothetical protein
MHDPAMTSSIESLREVHSIRFACAVDVNLYEDGKFMLDTRGNAYKTFSKLHKALGALVGNRDVDNFVDISKS